MKWFVAVAATIVLVVSAPASAHRLDEYLQATTFSVEKNHLEVEIRLTPGVQVLRSVLADIDANGDGVISESEKKAYALRVMRDLSFTIDGKRLQPRLTSFAFPAIGEMKEGMGEILLKLDASLPPGGPARRLVFEDHHQSKIAAYLVNCLYPGDPDIRVTAQHRSYDQSFYQLDYTQRSGRPTPVPAALWSSARLWLGANGLVVLAWIAVAVSRRNSAAKHEVVRDKGNSVRV